MPARTQNGRTDGGRTGRFLTPDRPYPFAIGTNPNTHRQSAAIVPNSQSCHAGPSFFQIRRYWYPAQTANTNKGMATIGVRYMSLNCTCAIP